MAGILVLGLGAAVYPQLLAIVVVILTRPEPKRLLWACWLGAVSVSVGCGVAVLLVFRDRSSVAGSTSHRLGASVYLVIGALAVLVAVLAATESGRALLGTNLRRMRGSRSEQREQRRSIEQLKARAEGALRKGSVLVAVGVGAILGVPGPFDMLALGRMTTGGYLLSASLALVLAFNLIKFLLIEVPIISYAFDPNGTAARVERFSTWLRENQITVIAGVVAIIGLVLIGRGLSRLS